MSEVNNNVKTEQKKDANPPKFRNKVGAVLDVTVDKMRAMADSSTIVGDAIVIGETTLIPVSKVSYGFASGGSDFASKNTPANLFAGGGGGGMTITPVAFVSVSPQGEVKILNINANSVEASIGAAERAIAMAPELIEQIKTLFKKDKDEKKAQ